jgi:hypothetical protein
MSSEWNYLYPSANNTFRIKMKTGSIGLGEGSQFSIPHGDFGGVLSMG